MSPEVSSNLHFVLNLCLQQCPVTFFLCFSANIELTGRMLMDSHFIETGLKVTSSILTSTGADISVKLLDNGKGIDVKMGLPVEKQTLMSFKHDIVFSTQEIGKQEADAAIKFKDKMKEFSICFDQLTGILGLSFCGEINTPSKLSTNMVPFPLNGKANFHFEVHREDVKEYHFKALLKDQKPHEKSVEIVFDTPGSQTKRTVELNLVAMTEPTKALKATLKSPFKEAVAEAVITDTNKEKSAMLRFQHDQSEYYGKIGVSVEGDAAKQVFKPLIEYHTPNDIVKTKGNRKPDYHVEGKKTSCHIPDNPEVLILQVKKILEFSAFFPEVEQNFPAPFQKKNIFSGNF